MVNCHNVKTHNFSNPIFTQKQMMYQSSLTIMCHSIETKTCVTLFFFLFYQQQFVESSLISVLEFRK